MINAQRLRVAMVTMAIIILVLMSLLGVLEFRESIPKAIFVILAGFYFSGYTMWMSQQVKPIDSRIARLYED
ncbi:MAG: hypothetical protein JKX76_04200 [Colwellia sp.]|nr:hypothetical protein [Colwellia sp.]